MSAPDSYAPGRDACELLKWFFAHEATFPKDPIALLRHIGIVVSANLAHTAASDEAAYWESWSPADGGSDCSQSYFHPTLDLATDLQEATFDEQRRVVVFDPDDPSMYAPTRSALQYAPTLQGWSVAKVYNHRPPDPCNFTQMPLHTVKYWYVDGARQNKVTLTAEPPGGVDECVKCCATFRLQGVQVFWYCYKTFQVFCLSPEADPFRLHAVSATPSAAINMLYDGRSKVAWRVRGFCVWSERRDLMALRFAPGVVPFPGKDEAGGIFDPYIAACPWPEYDVGFEMLAREWERQFKGLERLFASTNWNQVTRWALCRQTGMGKHRAFPAIGRLLQEQLERRLVCALRDALLGKAQALEEERARDPVKRCAACAVQAAKDQLVLGLEPASKRQCA